MRSMSAPALLGLALGGRRRLRQPAEALGSALVRRALVAAAAGEMVADKMPGMPARTAPPVLAGRIASGVLVGAAVAAAQRSPLVPSAVAGAAGAVAASYAMLAVRRAAGERLGVPDATVAVAEDAMTLSLGHALAERAAG